MKALKASIKVAFVIVGTLAVIVFAQTMGAFSQAKTIQSPVGMPYEVAEILRASCAGCHGVGGNPMAMGVWNFTKWDTYSVKKQAKKSNSMCNAITNGSMPPSSAKQSNPDKVLTAAQTEAICRWSNSQKLK